MIRTIKDLKNIHLVHHKKYGGYASLDTNGTPRSVPGTDHTANVLFVQIETILKWLLNG